MVMRMSLHLIECSDCGCKNWDKIFMLEKVYSNVDKNGKYSRCGVETNSRFD
jgi:hypothetical protein